MKPATAPVGKQTSQILPTQHLYRGWAARSVLCAIKNQEICTQQRRCGTLCGLLAFLLFTLYPVTPPGPFKIRPEFSREIFNASHKEKHKGEGRCFPIK